MQIDAQTTGRMGVWIVGIVYSLVSSFDLILPNLFYRQLFYHFKYKYRNYNGHR